MATRHWLKTLHFMAAILDEDVILHGFCIYNVGVELRNSIFTTPLKAMGQPDSKRWGLHFLLTCKRRSNWLANSVVDDMSNVQPNELWTFVRDM